MSQSSFTSDSGAVAILLAVAVLLPVCALLRVMQTQFVTNLEGLAHSPNNTHGLALRGGVGGGGVTKEQARTRHVSFHLDQLQYIDSFSKGMIMTNNYV